MAEEKSDIVLSKFRESNFFLALMNDDVISEIFFAEKIIIFKRFKYDQDISKLLILSPEEISNMKAVSCLNIII